MPAALIEFVEEIAARESGLKHCFPDSGQSSSSDQLGRRGGRLGGIDRASEFIVMQRPSFSSSNAQRFSH
jgi:hypothetical protein